MTDNKNLICEYCNKLNKNVTSLKNPKLFKSKFAFRCLDCGLINDNIKNDR